MVFNGIRVIKANVEDINQVLGRKAFRLIDMSMYRDGQWWATIECPLFIMSIEFMRLMDIIRKYSSHYFISSHDNHIHIYIR